MQSVLNFYSYINSSNSALNIGSIVIITVDVNKMMMKEISIYKLIPPNTTSSVSIATPIPQTTNIIVGITKSIKGITPAKNSQPNKLNFFHPSHL